MSDHRHDPDLTPRERGRACWLQGGCRKDAPPEGHTDREPWLTGYDEMIDAANRSDMTPLGVKVQTRYYRCTCCGASYHSDKPQDWNLDSGFGRCEECKPRLAADMVKYGWGSKQPTEAEALAHVERYA
jgi:hypothetical protein